MSYANWPIEDLEQRAVRLERSIAGGGNQHTVRGVSNAELDREELRQIQTELRRRRLPNYTISPAEYVLYWVAVTHPDVLEEADRVGTGMGANRPDVLKRVRNMLREDVRRK